MATLKVPPNFPAPSENSEQLRKAFQGYIRLFIYLFYFIDFHFVNGSSLCVTFFRSTSPPDSSGLRVRDLTLFGLLSIKC